MNPDMISEIENAGLSFVGKDETGRRTEVTCSYKTLFNVEPHRA